MKRSSLWILLIVVFIGSAFIGLRHTYVLSSSELDATIMRDVPVGSSKSSVVSFIKTRHPVYFEEDQTQVKVRLSGLAENMIYRKDVILIFEFDSQDRLVSHSAKSYFTFL